MRCLIFVGTQYETCYISFYNSVVAPKFLEKIVLPDINIILSDLSICTKRIIALIL